MVEIHGTRDVDTGTVRRDFYSLRTGNELHSNLTELNAAETVDSGFINHTDWAGHVMRYGYIAKQAYTVEKPESVLDVGCGTLQMVYFMWKNRFPFPVDYWGLDLRAKRSWLDDCRARHDVSLVQCDVVLDEPQVAIPSMPRQFDMTICTEVLEHVPRHKARVLIDRLYSWTRPGGVCFLSTPNAGVSDSTAQNHVDPDTKESREWTYRDKIAMVESAGFSVEDSFGTFGRQDRIKPQLEAMPWFEPNPSGGFIKRTMWDHPLVQRSKTYFNHSWFITFLAATFPEQSNNALLKLRRTG